MNEDKTFGERLRQADTGARHPAIDAAALAARVHQLRRNRKRRRAAVGVGAAAIAVAALATTAAMMIGPSDTDSSVAEVAPATIVPGVEIAVERDFQRELAELAELQLANERMLTLLDERESLDAQFRQITQLSNQLREYELDKIRARLSQSVFDNTELVIVPGF